MKKLLLSFVAALALTAPAAAMAHNGHDGWRHQHAVFAKLTGTGAGLDTSTAALSGSIAMSGQLGTGTFAATVTTDWTKATTHTGTHGTLSCAPATAALTLTGATTTNTVTSSVTGKTCTWTPAGGTTTSAFFGRGTATGAGAVASLTGTTAKVFVVHKADGSVHGAVFAGFRGDRRSLSFFENGERDASNRTGHCDH